MHTLSNRSLIQYQTLHPDLQRIIDVALKCSDVDFVIVEGHRPVSRQQELFKQGLSKIDGVKTKGKHNYNPSMAFDFCVAGTDIYDRDHMMYLIGVFTSIGKCLKFSGDITHNVRSGANWDQDGILIKGQKLVDLPHIEIWK